MASSISDHHRDDINGDEHDDPSNNSTTPPIPPPGSASATGTDLENQNPLLRSSNPLVSDLEQEILDEYARLLGNVNKVGQPITDTRSEQHP